MYKAFSYMVEDEVHPEFFPVEIENPEELPPDMEFYYQEEEFT